MLIFDRTALAVDRPVLWTRGRGCRDLAEVLSDVKPVRVTHDLSDTCIEHRAELLVSRRLPASSDLISGASPIDFDTSKVQRVAAAVAGGPNSVLAAEIAARIGEVLGVPARMISAYGDEPSQGEALATIESISAEVPSLEYRLVEAQRIGDLTDHLGPGTLLVLGASGGSWFQRMFFGPGAKLRSEATVGAVVIRRAPQRVFQVMEAPIFAGPMLRVGDFLRTFDEPVVAVVDDGILRGVVSMTDAERAPVDSPIGDLIHSFTGIDVMAAVVDLPTPPLAGAALPVILGDGRLVGSLRR